MPHSKESPSQNAPAKAPDTTSKYPHECDYNNLDSVPTSEGRNQQNHGSPESSGY